MSETITVEKIADEMYQVVSDADSSGKRTLKAGDLTKAMQAKFGEAACSKDDCKKAIRTLIESGKCTYSYVGGSYIVLPPKEGSTN
jgi:hypothetical protein